MKKDGGTDFDPTEPVMLIKRLYSLGVRVLDITMGNEAVICGLTPEKACNFKEFAA